MKSKLSDPIAFQNLIIFENHYNNPMEQGKGTCE